MAAMTSEEILEVERGLIEGILCQNLGGEIFDLLCRGRGVDGEEFIGDIGGCCHAGVR